MNSEALAIAVTALRYIAPEIECENFTSGVGSCFRDGRTVDATDGADRCCDSCIAHDALERINNLLGEEALSNAAKKIGSYGGWSVADLDKRMVREVRSDPCKP